MPAVGYNLRFLKDPDNSTGYLYRGKVYNKSNFQVKLLIFTQVVLYHDKFVQSSLYKGTVIKWKFPA